MSAPRQFVAAPGEDARTTPVRVVVVQGEERPPVDVDDEPVVMTFPHLIVRELIAFFALSIVLIGVSLVADAPLEEIADATRTPNPAKAPWYFLGLQELLHYYPPLVSGVLLASLLIVALIVIPYFPINLERPPFDLHGSRRRLGRVWAVIGAACVIFYVTGSAPVWPFIGTLLLVGAVITLGAVSPSPRWSFIRSRSLPFWVFAWFLLAATVLTIIGVFFRGPGWSFTLPWRDGVF